MKLELLFFIFFRLIRLGYGWHAYNLSLVDINPLCPHYVNSTRPYSADFVTRLRLWPGLMNNFDIETGLCVEYLLDVDIYSLKLIIKIENVGESLYGSERGLSEIYNSQHSNDCSNKKYIISNGFDSGFGSRLHVEGVGLAIAMHMDRIFLPHPDGDNINWETKIPFCQEQGEVSYTCFYEPWSNCTFPDALKGKDINAIPKVSLERFDGFFENEEQRIRLINELEGLSVFLLSYSAPMAVQARIFKKALPNQVH